MCHWILEDVVSVSWSSTVAFGCKEATCIYIFSLHRLMQGRDLCHNLRTTMNR